MYFIIERPLRQFFARRFRADVCSWAYVPCVGSSKRKFAHLPSSSMFTCKRSPVLNQQIPALQQADSLNSSRNKQLNSADMVVSFVRASFVSPVCSFWLIIERAFRQFVTCRFRAAYMYLGVCALPCAGSLKCAVRTSLSLHFIIGPSVCQLFACHCRASVLFLNLRA